MYYIILELQKNEVKRLKSLSRVQNRTLVPNVDYRPLSGPRGRGLASASPLIYMDVAPSKARKAREAAPLPNALMEPPG